MSPLESKARALAITAHGAVAMPPWPQVTENDPGIRPAGKPDECFYCRRKVGAEHGRDCVMVSKLVEHRVTVSLGVVSSSALWRFYEPHSWDADMSEFHKNESSWCADNFTHDYNEANVTWEGPNLWAALVKLVNDAPDGHCQLCPVFTTSFVRVVDGTPVVRGD